MRTTLRLVRGSRRQVATRPDSSSAWVSGYLSAKELENRVSRVSGRDDVGIDYTADVAPNIRIFSCMERRRNGFL